MKRTVVPPGADATGLASPVAHASGSAGLATPGAYAAGLALGFVAILTAVTVPVAPTQAADASVKLRIGLVQTVSRGLPPMLLYTALAPFRSFVEEQTGLTGEIVLGGDSIALGKKLHDDEVQLGVFHGHEFAWARTKYPKLEALVVCAIKGRDSRVVLVVRKDSKYRSVADLRGKVVSLPRMNRGYCRLYFEKHCVSAGTTPEKFYARTLTPFDIEDGLNHVVTRKSAAAVVDALALEEYGQAFPARARCLRVLQESDPFPGGVLACYNGRFPAAEARRLRSALVAAKDTAKGKKALRSLRVSGFVAPPEDHATTLEAILKAYPPPGK